MHSQCWVGRIRCGLVAEARPDMTGFCVHIRPAALHRGGNSIDIIHSDIWSYMVEEWVLRLRREGRCVGRLGAGQTDAY